MYNIYVHILYKLDNLLSLRCLNCLILILFFALCVNARIWNFFVKDLKLFPVNVLMRMVINCKMIHYFCFRSLHNYWKGKWMQKQMMDRINHIFLIPHEKWYISDIISSVTYLARSYTPPTTVTEEPFVLGPASLL